MKITTVILARDNANTIGRAIKSVSQLTDDVLVIDTGSQDSTVCIAERLGARVECVEWEDSFSSARNAAFALAPKDGLIFYLDSDEWVEPESIDRARDALSDLNGADGCYSPIIIDSATGRHALWVPRVVSADSDLRFRYRVHERLCHGSVEEIPKQVELRILHDGYTSEALEKFQKRSRNLHLLELSLRENPGDPHLLFFQLRDGLDTRSIEENRATLAQIEQSVRDGANLGWRDFVTLSRKVLLANEWFLRGPHKDTLDLAESVLDRVPLDPDATYVVSIARLLQAKAQMYESLVSLAKSRQEAQDNLTWSMSETPVHVDASIGAHLAALGDRRYEDFMSTLPRHWNDAFFENSVLRGSV